MLDLSKLNTDVPRFRPGSLTAYSVAVGLVALATVIRVWLLSNVTGLPYAAFFPAIVLATLFCGSRAALLALVLSLLSVWAFIGRFPTFPPFFQSMAVTIGSLALIGVAAGLRSAGKAVRDLNATLAQSESKFRALLELAPDAIVISNAAGRIVLVNAEAERLFGFDRAEILGQPLELLLLATVADEQIGRRKDGSTFPAEISVGPLETGDGALASCVIRDITERKQIETRLRAANRAKSDFLQGMSHELRTPLNAVVGFAELLRLKRQNLTEQQVEYVDHILEGGNHLLALVTQLLDLAGIEAGRLSLAVAPVDARHVVDRVYHMMQPLAETAGLRFSLNIPADLPQLQADELRLRQVLINFISNAIKYNRKGGDVVLAARAAPHGIRFVVSDTGPGIPAERQGELFMPFHRLGAESSSVGGSGIGLAYSKRVVEAMGGAIGFESEVGKGSAFWMDFPAEAMAKVA